MTRYFPYLLIFLLGGGIGFIIGKGSGGTASQAKPEDKKTEIADNSEQTSPFQKVSEVGQDEPVRTEKPTKPLPITVDCISKDADMSKTLSLFSEKLEKDSIWYSQKNPKELKDCSGIFFRIANEIKSNCGNYKYPDPEKVRSSRAIARWYHDNNNLSLVHDPMVSRELIEPGAVMFFGKSNAKYENVTIDLLSGVKGLGGEITHMGVVTEVKKNEEGEVIGYVMMHGHRKGKIAHRTHYHGVEPPRLNYPILGNWNQQWVAVANIMTPMENIYTPSEEGSKNKFDAPKPVVVAQGRPNKEKVEETETALPVTLDCFSSNSNLGNELTKYSQELEGQKIMYSQVPPEALTDCSGIFFRMTNFVKKNCTSYIYPNPKEARNTKSLARWYHNQGNLLLFKNPQENIKTLVPGSVLFFGAWGKKYADLSIDIVSGAKGIQHMGVVTEVLKNDAGEITGYWMMHGRSKGKIAKRTFHSREKKPAYSGLFDHWGQQLVAVANIMTPKATEI